jgi:hypothetical protein
MPAVRIGVQAKKLRQQAKQRGKKAARRLPEVLMPQLRA